MSLDRLLRPVPSTNPELREEVWTCGVVQVFLHYLPDTLDAEVQRAWARTTPTTRRSREALQENNAHPGTWHGTILAPKFHFLVAKPSREEVLGELVSSLVQEFPKLASTVLAPTALERLLSTQDII